MKNIKHKTLAAIFILFFLFIVSMPLAQGEDEAVNIYLSGVFYYKLPSKEIIDSVCEHYQIIPKIVDLPFNPINKNKNKNKSTGITIIANGTEYSQNELSETNELNDILIASMNSFINEKKDFSDIANDGNVTAESQFESEIALNNAVESNDEIYFDEENLSNNDRKIKSIETNVRVEESDYESVDNDEGPLEENNMDVEVYTTDEMDDTEEENSFGILGNDSDKYKDYTEDECYKSDMPDACFEVIDERDYSNASNINNKAYAKGRFIVKFNSDGRFALEDDFESLLENKEKLMSVTAKKSPSLKKLIDKYDLKKARSLFVKRKGLSLDEAKEKLRKKRAARNAKFEERSRKLPKKFMKHLLNKKRSNLIKRNKLKEDVTDEEMEEVAIENSTNVYVVEVPEDADIEEICKKFEDNPYVEYAKPDYLRKVLYTPTDPLYTTTQSWGQEYYDLWALRKIGMSNAWDLSTGSGIVVAVLDTGVDYNHEDILNNIWNNSAEFNGVLGDDDDDNGLIDDIKGWNYFDNDNETMDYNGHGTHVAGIIASRANSVGIIGVAPDAEIMPIKVLDDDGYGSDTTFINGINYAIDQGADILNASLGCTSPCPSDELVEQAISDAYSAGMVVVLAAGNGDEEGEDVANYSPQNMDEPIVVAASTYNDEAAFYSFFGSKVDVIAPGGGTSYNPLDYLDDMEKSISSITSIDILSLAAQDGDNAIADDCATQIMNGCIAKYGLGEDYCIFIFGLLGLDIDCNLDSDSGYMRAQGTSMAAPFVAGIAALVMEEYGDFTNEQVAQAIKKSSDDVGLSNYGEGRINALAALELDGILYPTINSPGDKEIEKDDTLSFTVSGTDPEDDDITYSVSINGYAYGYYGETINSSTGAFSWTPDTAAGYLATFTAEDEYGFSDSDTITITVTEPAVPNNAPELGAIEDQAGEEGSELTFQITATDDDAEDTLTLTPTYSPDNVSATLTESPSRTWTFSWTPDYDEADTYTATFEVSDGEDTDSKEITITISDKNQAPTITAISDKTVLATDTLEFDIVGSDGDGDTLTLTYDPDPLPDNVTITEDAEEDNTWNFSWTPAEDQAQADAYDFTFTVSDAEDNASEDVAITVASTAKLTSHTDGESLTSDSETFEWSAGTGVDEYAIYVGTTAAGSYDIYKGNATTDQTATVDSLPIDGSTIYVRLLSNMGGSWENYEDYIFTAAVAEAVITSPEEDTILTSDTQLFQWSSGVGIDQYWLWIRKADDTLVYSSGFIDEPTTSVTVDTLPTDGSTLSVQLLSFDYDSDEIYGQSTYYSYTAQDDSIPCGADTIAVADEDCDDITLSPQDVGYYIGSCSEGCSGTVYAECEATGWDTKIATCVYVGICGNEIIEAANGEECDEGDDNGSGTSGCSSTCKIEAYCGDDTQDPGEDCDDGGDNGTVCTPDYGDNCTYCSSSCEEITLQGGSCGDSTINGTEVCDDGSSNGVECTPDYGGTCTYCSADCSEETELIGGSCGDETKNGSEECDDGTDNGEVCTPDYEDDCTYCSSTCTQITLEGASCGDGSIDSSEGEECDDGNTTSNDGCSSTCLTEFCGDGVKQSSEACDDGNKSSNDGCSSSCVVEYCGDGIKHTGLGEECDDGNSADNDGCFQCEKVGTCGNKVCESDENMMSCFQDCVVW